MSSGSGSSSGWGSGLGWGSRGNEFEFGVEFAVQVKA